MIATIRRGTTYAVVATCVLLSLTSTIQPTHGKSISKTPLLSLETQAKLKALRQLSIEAGLPQTNLNEDVCYTDGCIDAAFDILSAMNARVNPCDDFYQYSCGRWIDNHPVPDSSSMWARYSVVREEVTNITLGILTAREEDNELLPLKKAKQLYRECMNQTEIDMKALDQLKAVINQLGGWQLLNPGDWDPTKFDWMQAIADTNVKTGQTVVVGIYQMAHFKDNSKFSIYIDQPYPLVYSFGMPWAILVNRAESGPIFEAYENFIVEVAKQLGSPQNDDDLKAVAKGIVEFEEKIAKLTKSEADRYEKEHQYNPYKLKEYQELTDKVDNDFKINWNDFLNKFFAPAGIDDITEDEEIIVPAVDYAEKLIKLLAEEEKKDSHVLANYIVWRAIAASLTYSTTAMRDINFNFWKTITGQKEQPKREETCGNLAGETFGFAVSTKYLETEFDEAAKDEMYAMVADLKDAFGEMVWKADWMKNETKLKAIEKKDEMATLMAYPEWIKNNTAVEEFYKDVEMGDGFFDFMMKFVEQQGMKGRGDLRKPYPRDDWFWPAHTVNAFHVFWVNTIVFPAGFLRPPFFGGDRPKHQNYGAIGMVIGHEITHGFDKQGAQYDKFGNLENWWDEDTKKEYDNRGQCISEQYSKYCYNMTDGSTECIRGDFTQGENIGDNGGLRHSFQAYKNYVARNGTELRLPGLESLTTEQLFFIGYANIWCESNTEQGLMVQLLTDPHSPGEWRVKGPMRNMVEFSDTWSCPIGSNMNPPVNEKCTVW